MPDNELPIEKSNDSTLETVKWIATISISAMGAGIVALTLFAGLSLNSEKKSLQALEEKLIKTMEKQIDRVDSALSQIEEKPNVIAFSKLGKPLNGNSIKVTPQLKKGKLHLTYRIILKNTGNGSSGPLFVKFYTNKPLTPGSDSSPSSDEAKYDYEAFSDGSYSGDQTRGSIIPAQASFTYKCAVQVENFELFMKSNKELLRHPVLLKLYYGSDTPSFAEYFLEINKSAIPKALTDRK